MVIALNALSVPLANSLLSKVPSKKKNKVFCEYTFFSQAQPMTKMLIFLVTDLC